MNPVRCWTRHVFPKCRRHVCGVLFGQSLIVALLLSTAVAVAQEKKAPATNSPGDEAPEIPADLLDRDPFWELTLDAANDNKVLEIAPPADDEEIPAEPRPSDRLRVRLLEEPGQEYTVQWRHIARLRTYEQLVFEEAQQLTEQGDYVEAFRYFEYLERTREDLVQGARRLRGEGKDEEAARYLNRLQRDFPDKSELERAILEYLLKNADDLIQQREYRYALALLEEVVRRDETYRAAEVATRISRVAGQLISAEVKRENYANARGIITRLEDRFGQDRIQVLAEWREKLVGQAEALRQQVEQKMEQEQFRQAERLSRRMIRIWPNLPGVAALRAEIARRHPMVIVGVAEVGEKQDVNSIGHWAQRRTGSLTQRMLVQFLGAGPEGGQYLCPRGEYFQSDDRRRFTLRLAEGRLAEGRLAEGNQTDRMVPVDGYDVSRRILNMADPGSGFYTPTWASLIAGTRVEDVFTVHVHLRHPHVLPEAMLQFQLDEAAADHPNDSGPGQGPYRKAESMADDQDLHFVANPAYPFPEAKHPAEIVERRFKTSDNAIAALRRGDIDVIDYLFPGDVTGLRDDESVQVLPYALPTIHLLVPSYDNPFTADPVFRRAILYGINRQRILRNEVLGNQDLAGCQVISGPFPVGTGKHDPLAYAYNKEIEPRGYYPRLALVLKTLSHRSLRKTAEKRDEKIPDDVKLTIGYPGNEVARVACQAISQYLEVVGIECRLVDLSEEQATDLDLRYMQVAMWEPVLDARRLLAPNGLGAVGNQYVGMALRRLDVARNWREVRARLQQLHRITHEQLPVLPLWQTVDHMAHNQRLAGVGSSPLTLYQDVEQWRVVKPEPLAKSEATKR